MCIRDRLGYLSETYMENLEKAWNFVDNNIENTGVVHESCTGTGSLQKLSDYLIRKRENFGPEIFSKISLTAGILS